MVEFVPVRFPCFFCIAAVLVFAGSAGHAERMDGTRWKVTVTPDEDSANKGAKEFDDELIFAEGQFTSTVLQAHGFRPGTYRFETEDEEVEWSADKQSDTGGKVGWGGRVNGKTTSGNFHWLKKDGSSLFFKFTGKKQ